MVTKVDLAERDRRYKRLREAMAKEGMEALLVIGHGSKAGYIRYLTEYQTGGHWVMFLLPMAGDPVAAISSPALPPRVAVRGWVAEVHGGFNVYDVTLISKMIDGMKRRGLTKGKVGIVGHDWVIAHHDYQKLRTDLPNVQFVNADEMMDRIKTVKSPLEVQMVRETHKMVRDTLAHFLEMVKPGKPLAELVEEVQTAAKAGGAGERVTAQISEGSPGARSATVKGDDILRMYFGARSENGYGNEHLLTCLFRKPTELEAKLMESELRAYEELRKMAKPGLRLSDLSNAFDRVFREDGWSWDTPRGSYDYHGIGLDGVERPCYADVMRGNLQLWQANQDWKLEAPVAINYHPRRILKPPAGVKASARDKEVLSWFPSEVMLGINEDILITSQGAERLLGDLEIAWVRMDK